MSEVDSIVSSGLARAENDALLSNLEATYVVPKDTFSSIYNGIITSFLKQYIMTTSGSVGTDSSSSSDNIVSNTNVENTTSVQSETSAEMTSILATSIIEETVTAFVAQDLIISNAEEMAKAMTEATMQKTILTKVGELTGKLMEQMSNAFNVDQDKIAGAFNFEMDEDELQRIFQSFSSTSVENADTNLTSLGYQDLEEPTSISFYFKDFDSKELFLEFIDDYNEEMEKVDEEKVIKYSDITGVLMSSVSSIVDSVSYILIAFVSISLVVSSIMIGIITYISVLERTKEIGVLRAIGASKKNISSIFNAETFIVGLFSGLIGIVTTLVLLIPTNIIIYNVNSDVTAVLPAVAGAILVALSIILTLIGGIIPSKHAAKKDPVLALRTD